MPTQQSLMPWKPCWKRFTISDPLNAPAISKPPAMATSHQHNSHFMIRRYASFRMSVSFFISILVIWGANVTNGCFVSVTNLCNCWKPREADGLEENFPV